MGKTTLLGSSLSGSVCLRRGGCHGVRGHQIPKMQLHTECHSLQPALANPHSSVYSRQCWTVPLGLIPEAYSYLFIWNPDLNCAVMSLSFLAYSKLHTDTHWQCSMKRWTQPLPKKSKARNWKKIRDVEQWPIPLVRLSLQVAETYRQALRNFKWVWSTCPKPKAD